MIVGIETCRWPNLSVSLPSSGVEMASAIAWMAVSMPAIIGSLESELQELVSRADSQCIRVPESVESAAQVLSYSTRPPSWSTRP